MRQAARRTIPVMSSLTGRLAIALGVLLVVAAVLVTFVPASPSGATCGNWVAPEWDDDTTAQLLEQARSLYDEASAAGQDAIASQALGSGTGIAKAHQVCSDALSTRRAVSLVLVGLAVVVPIGVLFVGGGRRKRSETGE